MRRYILVFVFFLVMACASASNIYVLDPPMNNLRAHDPKDDRKLSDCNPDTLPSGKIKYKCVAMFNADYKELLVKIANLEERLKACEQK